MNQFVWQWTPTIDDRLKLKIRRSVVLVCCLTALFAVLAVTVELRLWGVMTLMMIAIGLMGHAEHRRFVSTVVGVDTTGTLVVRDARSTSSAALAAVDMIDVTERSGGAHRMESEWVVEAAGPAQTMQHRLGAPGGLWQAPPTQIDALRHELRRQAVAAGARLDPGLRPDAADSVQSPPFEPPPDPSTVATTVMPAAVPPPSPPAPAGWVSPEELARFEWRPPVAATATRRRQLFRFGYITVTALLMVVAAFSVREDGVAAMVLSALVAPGIVFVLCLGLDWAIGRSRRFVLTVTDGVLAVPASRSGVDHIALRGSQVSIDEVRSSTHTGTTTTTSTSTVLRVVGADGSKLERRFPSFGVTTTRNDYLALERELRRRT